MRTADLKLPPARSTLVLLDTTAADARRAQESQAAKVAGELVQLLEGAGFQRSCPRCALAIFAPMAAQSARRKRVLGKPRRAQR